jgi:hypothetical protein
MLLKKLYNLNIEAFVIIYQSGQGFTKVVQFFGGWMDTYLLPIDANLNLTSSLHVCPNLFSQILCMFASSCVYVFLLFNHTLP